MIQSRERVKQLCDELMDVNPSQIVIDLVQDDIEEAVYSESVTPDEIGALLYSVTNLLVIYNTDLIGDIAYLSFFIKPLEDWRNDAEFANRALGLDPNK